MVCGCCGAKKKLLEMFYSVGDGKVRLCRTCWDVVERLESDRAAGEGELYGIHMLQLRKRAKNPSQAFLAWKEANYPD